MGVNSADKAFGTVAHPRIHNVRAHVLRTSRCESMAQEILRNFFIFHHFLKHAI